jgi:hypothetical protein
VRRQRRHRRTPHHGQHRFPLGKRDRRRGTDRSDERPLGGRQPGFVKLEARKAYGLRNPANQRRRVRTACTRTARHRPGSRTVTKRRSQTVNTTPANSEEPHNGLLSLEASCLMRGPIHNSLHGAEHASVTLLPEHKYRDTTGELFHVMRLVEFFARSGR